MKKHLFITIVTLLCAGINMLAQSSRTVTGTVADEVSPLPGVGVVVLGTTNGTVTDLEGNFTIKNVKQTDILVFSYVGYETVEMPVGKNINFNVTMKIDAHTLDDAVVVAVGYGDVRRRDLTGSIGKANMDDLIKAPVANIAGALSGRIAGVNVTSTDGGPGDNFDIVIRGAGSLTGSTAPLYVIDGFPQETQAMSNINPNDIESIDVLKDASATAIYGARGANGVIIITTKKGSAGKPTVTYNGSVSVSSALNLPTMMDAYDFVVLQEEIMGSDFAGAYLTRPYNPEDPFRPIIPYKTVEDYKDAITYDWQDEIIRTPVSHNHHVSLSGNNNGTRYSASLSYSDKQGVIINSGMKRYQGRFNFQQRVNKNVVIDMNVNYAQNVQDGPTVSENETTPSASYMYSVWAFRPVSPTGKDLLKEAFDDSVPMSDDYRFNPILSAQNEYRHKTTENLQANTSVSWQIIKGLKLKVMAGYSRRNFTREDFNGSKTITGNPHPNNTRYKGNNAYLYNTRTQNLINENTLSYNLNRKKHNFNALVGISFQSQSNYMHSIKATHISNEEFGMAGLGKTGTSNPTVEASQGENRLMSYFGRVNYNWDSRYYATLTMRADGSSKFSPENRWGYFPSGSLAWAFGREKFVKKNLRFLSNGKLRASYGMTGNNRIGNYDYLAQMVTGNTNYYSWNGEPTSSYILSNMSNPKLKWESTEQIDLGLDLGFFDDRIALTVDHYIKDTKDLLLNADISASSGFATAVLNVGELRNKGWEITLETINVKRRNFNWSSSLNFAFNENTVVSLNSGQDKMFNTIPWHNTFSKMSAYVSEVGGPAGQMYGYIYEGTYKYEDFDYDAVTGKYTIKSGIPVMSATGTQPGDPKYRDLPTVDSDGDGIPDVGDGIIDDSDRTVIGNGHPILVGGFSNNFSFYGFDLNVFFQWSYGNDILNANRILFENGYNKSYTNMFVGYKDRWTPTNPESDIPRAKAGNTMVYSTMFIEDGSYLKLRNVTLGYTFPKKALKKMKVSNLRVYLSAENLATFTNYSGMDPEVSTRHSVLTPGFDWSAYPRALNASFGVNLTF